MREKAGPCDLCRRFGWIAEDIRQFPRRKLRIVLWPAVESEPANDPNCAEGSCEEEGKLPAQAKRDPGYDKGSDRRPGIRARVKDPRGHGPFLFRKPLANGLDCRGKIPGLPEAERKADDAKTPSASH